MMLVRDIYLFIIFVSKQYFVKVYMTVKKHVAFLVISAACFQDVKNYANDPDLRGIEGIENLGNPDSVGLFSLTFMNRNKAGQPFLKDFEVIIVFHA